MNQWPVPEFVTRVAERVSSAGEEFASGLVDRDDDQLLTVGGAHLTAALAPVTPSPSFVAELARQLREAPPVETIEISETAHNVDRRIFYGVAMGSLASAAVAAAIILRYRTVRRAA
jgi:hypothetical protein